MILRRPLLTLGAAAGLAVAAGAAPAVADIRDVAAGVEGPYAEIIIEFEASPTAASAAPRPEGVFVAARGVIARARTIEAGGGFVRALEVRESEGGVELMVATATEPHAARAWIEGREVHVALAMTAEAAAAVPAAMTAAAPAPAATPGEPAPDMAASAADPATAQAADHAAATHGDAAAHDMSEHAATEPAPAAQAPQEHAEASHAGVAQTEGEHAEPVDATDAHEQQMHADGDAASASAPQSAHDEAASVEAAHDEAATHPEAAHGAEAGAGGTAHAAAPAAADGHGGLDSDALAHRDLSRPSVVYAGGLGADDCRAAEDQVRADPWDLEALRDYASCLALDGEAAAAVTAFERLLTFAPDDHEAQLGLAATRHELGEIDAAAATYQRLLETAMGDAEAARLRALMALSAAGPASH